MGSRALGRLACPELVGREDELAVIRERVAAAAAGDTSVITIASDAGLGKTALLTRAAEIARRAGLRVVRGDCVRYELRRSFGPFVAILRDLRDPGTSAQEALRSSEGGPASDGPATTTDRYRAHAQFARAFTELVAERPLLLAIDDLHWADDASLELFAYLSKRLVRSAVLIATFRPAELAARPVARAAIADLPRERLWELRPGPLADEEASRALRLILGPGARIEPHTRDLLHARCAGNPLFMEETLRALARREDLTQSDGAWHLGALRNIPLPSSVEDAVRERFDGLEPTTRTVLACAAVVGEQVDLDVVVRTTGSPENDVLSAMRDGVGAGLLDEEIDTERLRFRHPLVREAVLRRLLARERRELHARLANTLETRPGEPEFGVIAYHWDEAGERERAFDLRRRAGEQERARTAYAEALRHFERALELAPQDAQVLADLHQRCGEMLSILGPPLRALRHIDQARKLYERAGDARMVGHMLLATNAIGQRTSWTDEQRQQTVDRAFSILEPLGETPELAWALTVRALLAGERNDLGTALPLAEQAVAIGQRTGATWQLANAYGVLRGLRWASGDASGALEAARAAVRAAEGVAGGGARMDIMTLSGLQGLLERVAPGSDELASVVERQRQLAERHGVRIGEFRGDASNTSRLHSLFYVPDWDEFRRLHDDYCSEYDAATFDAAHLLAHRAFVEIARDGPKHVDLLESALPLMCARRGMVGNFVHVAHGFLLAERYEDTLRVADQVADFVAARPRQAIGSPVTGDVAVCAIIAASWSADDGTARRWTELLDWGDLPFPVSTLPGLAHARRYGDAERALRRGDLESCLEMLAALLEERSAGPLTGHMDPITTLFMRLRYVEIVREIDVARATAQLAIIAKFLATARASWFAERLRARAAEWRVPVPQAEVMERTPLTRREREIAALVAEGLTNREIAERLTLSIRTAESHVDQIRSKLGFRTRAQIAAWVAQSAVEV